MTHTGRLMVREVWRYPVKSMAGEKLTDCPVGSDGLLGDRWWAVLDDERGCIADARKLPALLDIHPRYARPPHPDRPSPVVELRLPDGRTPASDDPATPDVLSEHLGRKVSLRPRLPAREREHYLRVYPDDVERYLCELFGVPDLSQLPDLSVLPPEVAEFQTIPGTYFDAFPVHLVTTGDLEALERATGSPVAVLRFRPNLVVEGPAGPDWLGRTIRVGGAVLRVEAPCPRCVMISHPRQGIPADRALLRTVHRDFGHNVGCYASVERPGRIGCGDSVEVLAG
ncbi:MOSC domain-containing protein [Streptomyces orinoci]|uniref:MOSC N-terminal beta barrel domain-containing protein n=1 Tax=Streptomyces orinoci TaxID=67339 RepID=A0ABV3JQP0_STRON|nr:MOSC N-terminal beta barrel domain-containing protein [Streptomyces orinoci]